MAKDVDYKAMMGELTQLLSEMQDADIDVDQALTKYERGQELIKNLQKYLDTAENTLTKNKLA